MSVHWRWLKAGLSALLRLFPWRVLAHGINVLSLPFIMSLYLVSKGKWPDLACRIPEVWALDQNSGFSTGVWTQGLMLARQAFYPLSHIPNPFALVIFEIGSDFLPGLAWPVILLFYTSCHSWDNRHIPSCPGFSIELEVGGRVPQTFFAQAGLEQRSSQLQSPK
jgi:hypothetical protein